LEEEWIPHDSELDKMRAPSGEAFPSSHDLSAKFWAWEHPADRPSGAATPCWDVPPGELVSFPFRLSAR
jgi:hypothetical protein